jgi:hypothetical protein
LDWRQKARARVRNAIEETLDEGLSRAYQVQLLSPAPTA